MATGFFQLSHHLLRQSLHLPDNAEIVGVEFSDPQTCRVWVNHPDIPEKYIEGIQAIEVSPVLHENEEGEISLESWGIEK